MSQATPEKPPGTWLATVFVAYAHEDENVAVALQEAINRYAESRQGGTITVDTWEVKTELSKSILKSVQSSIRETDFGVFIYSPVDVKARDNVVFETGLCMGMKDDDHTILLLPKDVDVTPSDLSGFIGVEYPCGELETIDEYNKRVAKLRGVGAQIVDKIYDIMAEAPQNREQSAAGQPLSGASAGQPSAALEMFNAGWKLEAALGRLGPLEGDIYTGKFVVHAASGIGQVVGFDPPGAEPRYVEVQFGSVVGRCRTTDLFEPPIAFR